MGYYTQCDKCGSVSHSQARYCAKDNCSDGFMIPKHTPTYQERNLRKALKDLYDIMTGPKWDSAKQIQALDNAAKVLRETDE